MAGKLGESDPSRRHPQEVTGAVGLGNERNELARFNQIAEELSIDSSVLANDPFSDYRAYVERLKALPLREQKAAVRWWVNEGDHGTVFILLRGIEEFEGRPGTGVEALQLGWSEGYKKQKLHQTSRNDNARVVKHQERIMALLEAQRQGQNT
ncbi:MAG: hypothetical protein M1268_00450 [Patescibacteria group bacterium]|nr:hypothetical protein [Patescibacteria group bacterium]